MKLRRFFFTTGEGVPPFGVFVLVCGYLFVLGLLIWVIVTDFSDCRWNAVWLLVGVVSVCGLIMYGVTRKPKNDKDFLGY